MSDILWLDLETYSATPIKHGTDNYSRDTEITLFAYSLNDGPVRVWDCTTGAPIPADLARWLADEEIVLVAHNAAFEQAVLGVHGYRLPIARWRCTMAQALAHSLPGALEKLCSIFNVDDDLAKLKDGKALVKLFCMPQGFKHTLKREDFDTPKAFRAAVQALRDAWPGRATRHTHPEEWARFVHYCANDVESMRAVQKSMPNWNYGGRELGLWHLDQRINQRGVPIDVDLIRGAIITADRTKATLAAETVELTDGAIGATTQRNALLELLNGHYDLCLPDLRAATVERLLKSDVDLPPVVISLLQNRLAASSTSVSKYEAFDRLTGPDGRLRNTLQFCGAMRTGRWAGRGVQLQNLPRPVLKQKVIEAGIEAIKLDCADLIYDNPMELLSSAVRGCIIPTGLNKLVVADLSNIEGRMLAWLSGETWKLKAFADYDTCLGTDGNWYSGDQIRDAVLAGRPVDLKLDEKGEPTRKGYDLYALAYAKAFQITPEAVMDNKKNGDGSMRQVGKVMELACFGPDTQVITNSGIKSIKEVSTDDLLWDGSEWVTHRGVLEKGVRLVVNVAGIKVTPDHLIKTGSTWTPAGGLVTSENILCRALETGLESWLSLVLTDKNEGHVGTTWLGCSVRATRNPTLYSTTTCEKESPQGVMPVPKSRQDISVKTSRGMPTFARMMTYAEHYSTVFPHVSTVATTLKTLATRTMAGAVYLFSNLGERIGVRFWPTYSRSTVGTTKILNSTVPTSTRDTNPETFGSSRKEKTTQTEEQYGNCNSVSPSSKGRIQTYDIAYAGPRNCFTVISDKGPLVVHNCGYQGSVGAFATFAVAYGIDLNDMANNAISTIPGDILESADRSYTWALDSNRDYGMLEQTYKVCYSFVRMWRNAHAATTNFWPAVEKAVKLAILNPGREYAVNACRIVKKGTWLRIVLPSGRSLCYPAPRLEGEDEKISYMGVNQFSRQWCRLKTYGGKLVENITQAASRDVIGATIPEIEGYGYEILSLVHDEDITETPDTDRYSSDHLAALMASNPVWAAGLPLAAAGFEAYRYRKD